MREAKNIVYSEKVMQESDLFRVLESLIKKVGLFDNRILKGDTVLIKPNFVAPFPKATTDLKSIDFFVTKIREAGGIPVIGESSGFEFDTEATFQILGIKEFAEERKVELINFDKTEYTTMELSDLGRVEIAKAALEAKLILNLPVLKKHSITQITGAVKNFLGFLSKTSRRYLHFHRLEDGIVALARKFEGSIHFVDARHMLSRAVFSQSRPLNYYLAGLDPFSLDHFGSRLLSVNPESVKYLKGVGQYHIEGFIPDELPLPVTGSFFKERIYRMTYSTLYRLDTIKCSLLGGNSMIPSLHWYLGIHPKIGKVTQEELEELSLLCPVGAINIEKRNITREKCARIRCLKCYHQSKSGKVILRGFGSLRYRG